MVSIYQFKPTTPTPIPGIQTFSTFVSEFDLAVKLNASYMQSIHRNNTTTFIVSASHTDLTPYFHCIDVATKRKFYSHTTINKYL